MSPLFEELDYQETPLGPLSLRRRRQLQLDVDVVEVILGEEHLMSDLFTASEEALARLALAEVTARAPRVLVGGLGLGYTAAAALDHAPAAAVTVIDYLAPVIAWHRQGILPIGRRLADEPRCRLVEGDFFALAAAGAGLDPTRPGQRFDAVLLDIDHSPDFHLNPSHAGFYGPAGLARLAGQLTAGGVFALWSNDRPDPAFTDRLAGVFAHARAAEVRFPNPLLGREEVQTVYLAGAAPAPAPKPI